MGGKTPIHSHYSTRIWKYNSHTMTKNMINPEFNMGRGRAQINAEKD
jgi:hypothetical protein